MRKKNFIVSVLALFALSISVQKPNPYLIKTSSEFASPKGHVVSDPIPYGNEGIVQVNLRGTESVSLQKFSNELKLEKENLCIIENKFNKHVNFLQMLKLKSKTYLFVREVFKETKTEGITALEFFHTELKFADKAQNLFQSSTKVHPTNSGYSGFGFGYSGGSFYDMEISEDRTKFMYSYRLAPRERNDKLNKDILGFHVYDENLKKLWGGEYEMPYTEAIMDNLGYTLSNDGKLYVLAKVYENEYRKEAMGNKPSYSFEVLVYQDGFKAPKIIKINLDTYFPKGAYIYEDVDKNIVVAGFYGKMVNKPVDGAYLVKLDVEKATVTKVAGGYYEIPSEIIKAYTSDRQKRRLERAENKSDGDLGVDNLIIRSIYTMKNGSTKIVAEQYNVVVSTYYNGRTYTTRYDTYADDIFIMSISKEGKLEWVKKIPKAQHASDAYGAGLSINSMAIENEVHIFYIDNLKNLFLPENEAPKLHSNGRGGFLVGAQVSEDGTITKHNLGEIERFETNFFIRGFVSGDQNNLISTERKRKMNTLFSIGMK